MRRGVLACEMVAKTKARGRRGCAAHADSSALASGQRRSRRPGPCGPSGASLLSLEVVSVCGFVVPPVSSACSLRFESAYLAGLSALLDAAIYRVVRVSCARKRVVTGRGVVCKAKRRRTTQTRISYQGPHYRPHCTRLRHDTTLTLSSLTIRFRRYPPKCPLEVPTIPHHRIYLSHLTSFSQ